MKKVFLLIALLIATVTSHAQKFDNGVDSFLREPAKFLDVPKFFSDSKQKLPYTDLKGLSKKKKKNNEDTMLILNKTFRFLLKPLLTRSLVDDKGILEIGTGFSFVVDGKAATVSSNYSKILAPKKSPVILSAGFNATIDPEGKFVNIFKGGSMEFGFGANLRFTGLYNRSNSIFYPLDKTMTKGLNYTKTFKIFKDIDDQDKNLKGYFSFILY